MKALALCLAIGIFYSLLPAQLSLSHTFSQSMQPYEEISGGILLGNENSDNQRYVNPANPSGGTDYTGPGFDIGFNFYFSNELADRIAVNSNGWISLGNSTLTSPVNIMTTSDFQPLISIQDMQHELNRCAIVGFACDLIAQQNASIRLQTVGTAPNRKCIIQWHNYKRSITSSSESINFQIVLSETSNKTEIKYGPCSSTNSNSTGVQAGMLGTGLVNFVNRTSSTDWSNTVAGTFSNQTINFNSSIYPPSGLVFCYENIQIYDMQVMYVAALNYTPTINIAAQFIIRVKNNCPTSQTNYTVKLMHGNTVLASAQGTAVSSMSQLSVAVTWTPNVTGLYSVYGRVEFLGDQNYGNNDSSPIDINIMPTGISVVTGAGTWKENCPLDTSYPACISEMIYTSYDMVQTGTINSISFYTDFWDYVSNYPVKIWMGTTSQADLSSGWIMSTSLTQVFDGTINFPYGPNSAYIPLQSPFPYTGGNLVLMVYHPYVNITYTQFSYFYGRLTNPSKTRQYNASSNIINPTNLGNNGFTSSFSPKISFYFTTTSIPILSLSANEINFGQSAPGISMYSPIRITNIGGGSITVNNIAVTGDQCFSFLGAGTNLTFPITLAANQYISGQVYYGPASAGSFTANLLISGTINASVPIHGTAIDMQSIQYQPGDDIEAPFSMSSANSLFESIYSASQIDSVGIITALAFYNNFETNILNKPVKIWLGTTSLSDLSSGWIPANQLTQVYDGFVDFPSGQNQIYITLQDPFTYTGGSLVMMIFSCFDTNVYTTINKFKGSGNTYDNRSKFYTSNTETLSPNNPFSYVSYDYRKPTISIKFAPFQTGSISGTVSCNGTPVSNAEISLIGTNHTTQTNVSGNFFLDNVIIGNYLLGVTKPGYVCYSEPVTITAQQNTTANVNLAPVQMVTIWGRIVNGFDPTQGVPEAFISMTGTSASVSCYADINGYFSFSGVTSGSSYNYSVSRPGYSTITGHINIAQDDLQLGNLSLWLLITPPYFVRAVQYLEPIVSVNWMFVNPSKTNQINRERQKEINRDPEGSLVWRFAEGFQFNPDNWTLLTATPITATYYDDNSWISVPDGAYRYAVKGVYPGNILSNATYSNIVTRNTTTGTITGVVTSSANNLIEGAYVVAGDSCAFTDSQGHYYLVLLPGIYNVTASVPYSFQCTVNNIEVVAQQYTIVDFELVSNPDENNYNWNPENMLVNYPNPFNRETSINFKVQETCNVNMKIFNTKGQLVRELINDLKQKGSYQITWDGCSNKHGRVPAGIYYCRMTCNHQSYVRKLLLLN